VAIEVYKMEVGTTLGYFNRDWTFYWQVGNLSGRDPIEIAGDLGQLLGLDSQWFTSMRFLWGSEQKCRLFRIRRVWPALDFWNDYYYRFRHLGGQAGSTIGPFSVRTRIMWFTDRWEVRSPCTYFDSLGQYPIVNNQMDFAQHFQLTVWALQHTEIRTTPHGDQLRPCILDKFGNYSPILSSQVDRRIVSTRRHLWKG